MKFVSHPLIKKDKMESRLYQEQILGTIVSKDTLVCLPTAMGKTPIAILLAAQRLEKFPRSRILVMAPTKPLVNQHLKSFRDFMNLPERDFAMVTGMVKPEKRQEIYKEKKVIFATPQCLAGDAYVFDLENGPIKIEELFKNIKLNPERYGDKIGYSSKIKLKLLGVSKNKVKPVKAIKAWKLPNEELIEIETKLKNKIRCTPEHPLITIDKNAEIKWVKAEDLTENEFIGMIRNIDVMNKKIDIYNILRNSKLRIWNRKLIDKTLDVLKNEKGELGEFNRFKYSTMPIKIFFELCKNNLPDSLLLTDWTAKSPPIKLKRHFTPSMAYILGAFIGDGHIGNRKDHGGDVVFSDLDRPIISNKLETMVYDIFGILPKKDQRKGLVYYSAAFTTILNKMGIKKGNKATDIRVPKFLFFQEDDYVANFLSGLFNADGNASYHMITFATSSEGLAQDIKWLLLKLGMVSSIHRRKQKRHKIRGKPIKQGILYTVIVSERKQLERFIKLCKPEKSKCKLLFKSLKSTKSPYTRSADILPIADALKNAYEEHRKNGGKPIKGQWESIFLYRSVNKISEFLKKLDSRKARNIEKIISLPIRWVRIKSIKKIKDKSWVYDFTVENDHNFIANYLINHNTVQKDLEKGRLSLRDFSLLIIDEAHHSIGRYAYPYVSKRYREEADNPRILALTASPGGTREKIDEICKNIGTEEVEIRTEQDRDVMPYIKEKKVEWVEVNLPESFERIRKLIKGAYDMRIENLKKWRFLHTRRVSKKDLLALQAHLVKSINQGYKKAFLGMSYTVQAIKLEHALGLLETQGIGILEKYWSRLRGETTNTAKRLLNDKAISNAMFLTHSLLEAGSRHPKISRLCTIVSAQLREKPGSKIIIFANYRESVKEIYNVLDRLEGARPIILIGQKEGLSQKQQVEAIRNFGEGEHNILVCTSIGEEGLSIESADVAIFYESVASEIRQIQRRGRVGRTKFGRIIILVTKGTRDEAYRWSAYHKERRMHGVLYGMKQGSKEPGQASLQTFRNK